MTPPEIYACIYASEFPAQALLRLRHDLRKQPCAVVEGEPPLHRVCALNSGANAIGIAHGMTQSELDTFPFATTLPRSLTEEATAKSALLDCAGTFSPRVEDRSEDRAFICVIDIAGTEKLLGAPQALVKKLQERLATLGVSARIAVTRNFFTSICLARGLSNASTGVYCSLDEERTALASLPIDVLCITEEQAVTFAQWGIRTLGMLAALPEKDLISRMGQSGRQARLMARGEMPHLFVPTEPAVDLVEHMELDSPVELLDSLLFMVAVMLEQLTLRASMRVLALASVTVTLFLEGGSSHTRTVKTALPTNDRQLWIKLLHLDLEAHPPSSAILSLQVRAEHGPTSKMQLGLFSPQLPEPTRLDVTLARIKAIVGEECVGRVVLKDSHQPDCFTVEPFVLSQCVVSTSTPPRSISAIRQLRPAEQVHVTSSDHRPRTFFFRNKTYEVNQAYGPWLVSGDWWTHTEWRLEQWDLIAYSDSGMLCCCLVRNQLSSIWQMVALYD